MPVILKICFGWSHSTSVLLTCLSLAVRPCVPFVSTYLRFPLKQCCIPPTILHAPKMRPTFLHFSQYEVELHRIYFMHFVSILFLLLYVIYIAFCFHFIIIHHINLFHGRFCEVVYSIVFLHVKLDSLNNLFLIYIYTHTYISIYRRVHDLIPATPAF